jgi:hypothetical protein
VRRRGFLRLRLTRAQPKEVAYAAATRLVGGLRKVKRFSLEHVRRGSPSRARGDTTLTSH